VSNAEAMGKLRERIRRLRTIPQAIPHIAQAAVGEVRDIMAANVAAQRGPDGTPWPATNDGEPALVHAAQNLDVQAVNNTIVITVDGVDNRHHTGRVRGGRQREIIPSRSLPQPMSAALDAATASVLGQHLDG